MRATTHRGRTNSKGQVYSANHNDRNFDLDNAEHIDQNRTPLNIAECYNLIDGEEPVSFEDHEEQFYTAHFADWLEEQNAKHIQSRHYGRVKSMADIRKTPQYAPEEVIFQIGKEGETVNPDVLKAVHRDFIEWHSRTYPQCMLLDSAMHADEATAHFQDRFVWVAHKDGKEIINQEQALEEMGYNLPNPSKKKSRYNNRKMTYTAEVREKFIEICEQYGLEVEKEPLEASKTGLSLNAYKRKQEEEKTAKAIEERERAKQEARAIRENALEIKRQLQLGFDELRAREQAVEARERDLQARERALQAERAKVQAEQQRAVQAQQRASESIAEAEQMKAAYYAKIKQHDKFSDGVQRTSDAPQRTSRFDRANGMYKGE